MNINNWSNMLLGKDYFVMILANQAMMTFAAKNRNLMQSIELYKFIEQISEERRRGLRGINGFVMRGLILKQFDINERNKPI